MSWNYDSIRAERADIAEVELADVPREDLIARIVELESTLYPFYCVFHNFLVPCKSKYESMIMQSPLAFSGDSGELRRWDRDQKKIVTEEATQENIAKCRHTMEEIEAMKNGWDVFPDEFPILETVSYIVGGACFNGEITIRDVKNVSNIFNKPVDNDLEKC